MFEYQKIRYRGSQSGYILQQVNFLSSEILEIKIKRLWIGSNFQNYTGGFCIN